MEHDPDIIKLKELLRHTGEFIAYFELAETKMMQWRQDIEQQVLNNQLKAQQQLQSLHHELDALQEVLTQAGLARFRLAAEKTLKQGEHYIEELHDTSQQLVNDIDEKHNHFAHLMEEQLKLIQEHADEAIDRVDEQLQQCDFQLFRRIANDSCEQVEKVATNAISKSERLLRNFHLRSIAMALITTVITSFAIGLYMNNEFPWEIHQHVMNEREAGKVLIKAWPALTQEEKDKILSSHSQQKV